jgi:hypothetical protein
MTQQHPITPPEHLVAQMIEQAFGPLGPAGLGNSEQLLGAFVMFAGEAAKWGADQELEACCEIALTDPVCGTKHQRRMLVQHIRERRRPKPPSLKEQALEIVRRTPVNSAGLYSYEHIEIIRRALESIPDPSY